MSIKFEGKPPFYLGIAEVASAHALDGSVVLRATLSLPEMRPKSVPVQFTVATNAPVTTGWPQRKLGEPPGPVSQSQGCLSDLWPQGAKTLAPALVSNHVSVLRKWACVSPAISAGATVAERAFAA
jgi:hypothetical protein